MVWVDKMKKLKGILVLVLLMALLASPVAVLASNVTQAKFYGLIQVSNNGTAVTNEITTCNISTTNLINGGFLSSSANNCAIQSSGGADLPFQPGVTDDPWAWGIWVPAMGADSIKTDILYTANSTGGKIRYFPAAEGMTASDNDTTLELGDNFTVEQSGWVARATANATDTYLDFVRANSDWVSIPDSPDFDFTDGAGNDEAGTIIVWVNLDTALNNTLISKFTEAGNNRGWEFFTGTDNTVGLRCWIAGGVNYIGRRTASIESYEGDWVQLAATYSGNEASGGINLYVNGIDADTGDAENLPYAGMSDTTAVVELGSRDAGAAKFLDGKMAEAKIYKAELSPAEMLADFNGGHRATNLEAWWRLDEGTGNPTDGTANGHNATANSADWETGTGYAAIGHLVKKPGAFYTTIDSSGNITSWIDGQVSVTATGVESGEHEVKTDEQLILGFDGDDLVDCGNNALLRFTNPFTIMVWLKPDGADEVGYVVARFDDVNSGGYYLLWNGATDLVRLGGKGTTGLNSDAVFVDNGVWVHVAVTLDASGDAIFYRNNVAAGTANVGAYGANAVDTLIGNRVGGVGAGNFFAGDVCEVKIYDQDLSPAEITECFNGVYDETGLVAYYPLSEGAGATAGDISGNGLNGAITGGNWGASFLRLYVDDELEDFDTGASVPNTSANWTYYQNLDDYWDYTEITIGGIQVQYIDWEYDTIFYDTSGFDNDATPTFRGAPSDPDVTAEFVSFLPVAEAQAPAYVLEEGVDFIEEVPVIVSEWDVVPPAGEFPLAGVIVAVANATGTPAQLPLVIIAGFTIIALSLAISSIMRKYGSGTIFVKLLVIVGIMGVFVAIDNFGIDFWMIFVFAIIGISLAMASRHVSWQ